MITPSPNRSDSARIASGDTLSNTVSDGQADGGLTFLRATERRIRR
jgi:hypothetical protein